MPRTGRWRRPSAIASALVVAAAAIGFAWAFLGNGDGPPRPAATPCAGTLGQVPHPNLPPALGIEGLTGVTVLGPDDTWAVGSSGFLTDGPSSQIDRARILYWDGTEWRPVAAPAIDAFVHGLTGTFQARGRLGFLQSVDGVSADDVWAVGSAGGTLIEHWDGEAWSRVPSPESGEASRASLASVSAAAADDAWAVGSVGPLILHWDGARWSAVDVDAPGVPVRQSTQLSTVVALGPDDAWAAGSFFDDADDGYQVVMLHWDGSTWRQVRAPNVVPSGTTSVQALAATSSDDVWAVGSWSDLNHGGDPVHPLAEHWDGVRWRDLAADLPARSLSAASALRTGEVWSVGTVGGRGTGGRGFIAHRSYAT